MITEIDMLICFLLGLIAGLCIAMVIALCTLIKLEKDDVNE